jgi:hypothetical protein
MFVGIKKAGPKKWDKKTPIEGLRWSADHHLGLGTWGKPTTTRRFAEASKNHLTGGKMTALGKVGSSSDGEETQVLEARDRKRKKIEDAVKYYEDMGWPPVTSQHQKKLLDEIPQVMPGHEEGWDVEGTWVSPADMNTLTNPDNTINRQVPSSLIGVTKKPNWHRSAIHANKPTPEGFEYGGYKNPYESMYELSLPEGIHHAKDLAEDIDDEHPSTMDWLRELQENVNIPIGEPHEQLSWESWKENPPLTTEQLVEQELLWPRKLIGEPMDIAFQLLKERKMSPEAKRHKLEYDTKYESSPVRVKYREELNRERRRRGIYGSDDHKDVSHTEGGKLTLEGEHANRARHFKNRGTLRNG